MNWFSLRIIRWASVTLAACAVMLAAAVPTSAVEVPQTPDPVPVTLSATTTALVVIDITDQTCKPVHLRNGSAIASLLARARQAGVYVVYSVPPSGSPVLPEVTPAQDDPVFKGQGQDRFYNIDLDAMLQSHGITTAVLVGWRENGSVLYTSVGATLRGYTVVVADDGTSAAQDYDVAIGRYQMLTQLNSNPMNQPLRPNAVTLSRTDLITFQ